MKFLNTTIPSWIIFLLRACNTRAATSCFLLSGELASDPPWDPDASVSMCCANPLECLSNGLCLNPKDDLSPGANISYAQGTCTDDQWGSSICLQNCLASRCVSLVLDSRLQVARLILAKCFLSNRPRQRYRCLGRQSQK